MPTMPRKRPQPSVLQRWRLEKGSLHGRHIQASRPLAQCPSLASLRWPSTGHGELLFFWFSQPGEVDLPVDRSGMIVASNTDFLDTWEVS